ncbi:MAG: BamA/TamA family outer membrane protein [Cyclobacteriaceae bacterium]
MNTFKAIFVGKRLWLVMALLSLLSLAEVKAQYFGRNKPQYRSFDFEVLHTPHFEIYNYLKNDTLLNQLGELSERWYRRHQLVLADTFKQRNPLIMYNNHADFQQTGVIGGLISVGTGGVTEGLKNRVVMPFLQTMNQTDHVLGHELVHAFQFNMLTHGDSTNLYNIRNLPLWFIEGMAEYLSIGRKDSHTAMWMRDAVISEDIPSLKDLSRNPKYFPYRYGQAFWAFTTGIWGDTIVQPLFIETAKTGYALAIKKMTGLDEATFSTLWKNTIIEAYKPYMQDTIATVGQKLFSSANAGDMNLSPVYSNDGKYVAFLSEKDVLSIDLFLANAETGTIIRKLTKGTQKMHIDDYSYIETAGTFSPDNSRFAFVAFSKGKNILMVVETEKGKTIEELELPGLASFSDPAWSPDGRYIVVSGLKNGQTDLYLYDYYRRELTQLTNDQYGEIHPSWSADGQQIVFASNRGKDTDLEQLKYGSFKIATLDVASGNIEVLDFFPGADNLNPHFGPDDLSIYFVSNADGFRNLYEYDINDQEIFKLTKYFTGISGITQYSPTFTLSRESNKIAYTLYKEGKYTIYQASISDFPYFKQDAAKVDFRASILPPIDKISKMAYPQDPPQRNVSVNTESYEEKAYDPKFSLAHISNSGGVGVGTTSMGTGFQGGVNMLFSDILNDNQLFAGVSLNGEIYDFGAQLLYLNRKSRLNWGVGISHIPFMTGGLSVSPDTIMIDEKPTQVDKLSLITQRIFEDQISLFSHIPLSITQRIEGGLSFSRYSFRLDEYNTYYYGGLPMGQDRNKLESPEGFNIGRGYLAFVGDNSRFGITAPLSGQRYRFQIDKSVGAFDYVGILADYRKYIYAKPFSFAFRGMHYGRYGGNSNELFPVVIGNDFLVRGYDLRSFRPSEDGLNVNNLAGERMAVVNAEIRFPFTGPQKLSLIKSGLLFSDLALFMDGGVVWNRDSHVEFRWKPVTEIQTPVFSAGITTRINLFGYIILEPYYVFPFQRNDIPGGALGLNISAGGW